MMSAIYSVEIWFYSHQKNISSNQLFSNLFSKTVTFTKFLPKMHERIPVISTLCILSFHTVWVRFDFSTLEIWEFCSHAIQAKISVKSTHLCIVVLISFTEYFWSDMNEGEFLPFNLCVEWNQYKKLCQTAKPESKDQVDRPKIGIRQLNFQFESEAQIIHCLYWFF